MTAYLKTYVEAGARDFTRNFVPYSIPESMEMLELFAADVRPAFQK